MMDNRKALPKGTVLDFQGLVCELGEEIGRGSNSLVYQGKYKDALEQDRFHHILVKELFPVHPKGKIYRQQDGSVSMESEAQETFDMHRLSFEAGNRAHLTLLESNPDQIGANLNTYPLNGTIYSLLGLSGGESLTAAQQASSASLRTVANRMLTILDSLEIFHENGLVHMDIAPDNILLIGEGNRERALLIDYNSVMELGAVGQNESVVFSVKQGYTAPEVRSGRLRDIGFPSDLYSVTAVFYWMITGTALTNFQMIRALPPDVSGYPCIKDEPETVKEWIRQIFRRGLQTLPARRYPSVEVMRHDLRELIDRIDGIGITHWALWEAGKKQVERMIRENPALGFIQDSAALFPIMATNGQNLYAVEEYIRGGTGIKCCKLLGGGGAGKTTSLLHMIFSDETRYSADRPAMMYLSLYGWKEGNSAYILNSLLDGLHFRPETHTYEDARKTLLDLLDNPVETPNGKIPVLLLLLDGLNEVNGDTRALLDEINRLSQMPGVRLVVAGRTDEEALTFPVIKLTELSEDIVKETVSAAGMLLPQTPKMQQLLRTPMMLSMYVRSGQMEERQVRAQTSNELLSTYLSALKEKATTDLPEQTNLRWQIDAAVDLVLPSLAEEINRKQKGLQDRELLPVVEKCYRILNGQVSRRFFPKWIGHTAGIRGDAQNAEEWYGRIIHEILWKQLGLILRDDQGRYMIFHQVMKEYLLSLHKDNRKRIRRYYLIRNGAVGACFCILAVSSFLVYKAYIAPPAYEETYADNIMSRALDAYVRAGQQYELLSDLTECAADSLETFQKELNLYQNAIPYGALSSENAVLFLSDMLNTGEVMPWSGKPMDEEAFKELLTLAESREKDYRLFASVLEYVMTDDYARKHYGDQYPQLLAPVLETDADIAAELYQIVCAPHLTGKYADHSVTREAYNSMFALIPKQNEHLTGEDAKQAQESLTRLRGKRRDQLGELYQCGAVAAYEVNKDE